MGQNLRPESPLFSTILTFKISGEVDGEHFQRAFQATLDHSDALRTVINEIEGVPERKVSSDFAYRLDYVDFSNEPDAEETYQAWLQERAANPLKIDECMFDSVLVKISNDNFVWYLNQHHIVSDASSAFLVFERLAKFYELSMNGKPLQLPGLPQYEEYVEYERSYRSSPQYRVAEAYWQKKLTPGPEPMKYFGRLSKKKTTRVDMVSYDLGVELSREIRSLAKQDDLLTISEDLTLYNLFITMFFVQLHGLSGNHRLGLVTPVHNRFSVDSRKTVGLVMELCPYQIEVSENDTFMSIFNKVKRESRETMTYYQYGSGLTFRNETFDVMFNTHPMPEFYLNGSQVIVERIHPGHGSESLALHVLDNESTNSFLLNFYFHTDIFDPKQYQQVVQSYLQLLEKFVDDRNGSLKDIYLLNSLTEHSVETGQSSVPVLETRQKGSGLPQDLLEHKLIQIWEDILGVKPIGIHDNFFDLGGNSWMAVQLIVQIEKLTGQYLPLTTLLQMATIRDLARGIRQDMGNTLWSTLITIQSGGDMQPLFCVPGAGGNGLAIARIASHLGESQPVFMFQVPLDEEDDDEAPYSTIEEMAANYVEALLAHKPEGPYLLAGYSAGGLVAFEVAQQLQRQGQQVDLLAIIDVPAQSHNFVYLRNLTQWVNRILKNDQDTEIGQYIYLRDILFRLDYFLHVGYREWLRWRYMWIKHQVMRIPRFLQLDWNQKASSLRRKLGKSGQIVAQSETNNKSDSNLVEEGDLAWQTEDRYMRRYFETNSTAVKLYMPQPYQGRITLFRSSEGYQYAEQRSPDRILGWGRIARDGVEMYEIPGNHMQIVREPSVKLLGEQLKECIVRVQEKD
jgi:thioesterase domain-containing protein/acyl carrier protein